MCSEVSKETFDLLSDSKKDNHLFVNSIIEESESEKGNLAPPIELSVSNTNNEASKNELVKSTFSKVMDEKLAAGE